MPISSTKPSLFLVVEMMERSNKNCDVPKGFKAILLMEERKFYPSSDVTNKSLSKETGVEKSRFKKSFTRFKLMLTSIKHEKNTL